jgi:hypothetical protein
MANPKYLLNFDDDSWLDTVLSRQSTKDIGILFVWLFQLNPNNANIGRLCVQRVFVSPLPKKMQSLSRSVRLMPVAILAFIAAIGSCLLSYMGFELQFVSVASYFLGWTLVLFRVKQILSLLPTITRRRKRHQSPPEITYSI